MPEGKTGATGGVGTMLSVALLSRQHYTSKGPKELQARRWPGDQIRWLMYGRDSCLVKLFQRMICAPDHIVAY